MDPLKKIKLKSMLNIAIAKCPESSHDEVPIMENFDCNQICSKSKEKTLFEKVETKNLLLLFGLILFFAYIRK